MAQRRRSKEECREELLEYLFLTYLDFGWDRTKNREALLPRLRINLMVDLTGEIFRKNLPDGTRPFPLFLPLSHPPKPLPLQDPLRYPEPSRSAAIPWPLYVYRVAEEQKDLSLQVSLFIWSTYKYRNPV